MPTAKVFLAAVLLCAPAAPAVAQAKFDGTPRVTATGTCVAEIVPDRAALFSANSAAIASGSTLTGWVIRACTASSSCHVRPSGRVIGVTRGTDRM